MKDKNKDEETLDDVLGDSDKIAGMKKIDTNQINQNASKVIKSKDLHELLFQGTSNMMLYLSPLGKIIKVNKAGLTFSGFSEEEVIGRMFWKLPGVFPKRNIPKYLKVFKDSLKGKPVESFISDLKDKSGNTHIMDFSTHPIREDKKISSILVIARDITEQRKIEESLHKAESKFRLIAESTSDLIATARFDTTYTYVSPSHERIMGYSYNDLIGKRGLDFIHPDDKKMLLSLLGKYLTSKGKKIFTGKDSDVSEVFKYRVKHKSGEWRYLETTANFLGNEILLVSRDITERFQAAKKKLESSEEKYRDLAERYRRIADNVADVILQTTLPGKITYINPTCERITGFKPEEVIGKNFTTFAPKREWPRYFSKIKKMISGKKIVDFNTFVIHKDGHLVPVEFSGQKVKVRQ